jgi:predicted alpha/beta-hydrolase family hydrolase
MFKSCRDRQFSQIFTGVSDRMTAVDAQELVIETGNAGPVSGLLTRPQQPRACYVFAHGAGAGMTHSFMEKVAAGLSERGLATLRYQFPYMEKGSKRPDAPAVAHAAVRAAVAEAARCCEGLPLIAGGKSFGGRMTSQAQALLPLAGVRGLAFFGFPLHPAGKPSSERAKHLADVSIPMLFLQGTRDNLAELSLLEPVVKTLGALAALHLVKDADHSFHVPARSGRNDGEVMNEILDAFAAWADAIVR